MKKKTVQKWTLEFHEISFYRNFCRCPYSAAQNSRVVQICDSRQLYIVINEELEQDKQ